MAHPKRKTSKAKKDRGGAITRSMRKPQVSVHTVGDDYFPPSLFRMWTL